jgi:DNA-binding NarL/FixJ family response regulator
MNIRTMLVDDQQDVRVLMRLIIEAANRGLSVVAEAESGSDALAQLDATDPLVIVLDQMMPEMSGLEAAAHMRDQRPHQVIILCSAYLDNETIHRADELGLRACLPKEEISRLPDVIRRAVSGRD